MATWAELTDEQRDIYTTFERNLRGVMGQFQRICNDFRILDNTYNAQVQGILTSLDDNTIVPNTSGLAGAASLDSDAEMVTLVSYLQGILTNYNTIPHQQIIDKASGQQAIF